MFRRSCYSLTLISAVVALGGCGGGDEWTAERPEPFPAGGTVLYKGQPVEGATVVFLPDGHKHGATAQTDASGKFQLRTYDPGDGAVPGEYKVTIRKVETAALPEQEETNVNDNTVAEERWLIPEKYGSAETSGLTATVTEDGENNFPFELTD